MAFARELPHRVSRGNDAGSSVMCQTAGFPSGLGRYHAKSPAGDGALFPGRQRRRAAGPSERGLPAELTEVELEKRLQSFVGKRMAEQDRNMVICIRKRDEVASAMCGKVGEKSTETPIRVPSGFAGERRQEGGNRTHD